MDGTLGQELLKQPPTLSAERAPRAVLVRPVSGPPPPRPSVAAERLFLPADLAANIDLASCSVRLGSSQGMVVIVSYPPASGVQPTLAIVERWTRSELIFNELHPATPGGWRGGS